MDVEEVGHRPNATDEGLAFERRSRSAASGGRPMNRMCGPWTGSTVHSWSPLLRPRRLGIERLDEHRSCQAISLARAASGSTATARARKPAMAPGVPPCPPATRPRGSASKRRSPMTVASYGWLAEVRLPVVCGQVGQRSRRGSRRRLGQRLAHRRCRASRGFVSPLPVGPAGASGPGLAGRSPGCSGLGVEAAQGGRRGDAIDGQQVGADAVVDTVRLRQADDLVKGLVMISLSLALTTASLQWSRLRSWTHSK